MRGEEEQGRRRGRGSQRGGGITKTEAAQEAGGGGGIIKIRSPYMGTEEREWDGVERMRDATGRSCSRKGLSPEGMLEACQKSGTIVLA